MALLQMIQGSERLVGARPTPASTSICCSCREPPNRWRPSF